MDYLQRGLLALSRAYRANAMSGHLGAALVAVELVLADHPELPGEVADGLHREADLLMHGDESWYDPVQAGISIAELFGDAQPEGAPVRVGTLPTALEASIDEVRESGHNVIFAALALRGLAARPELVTAGMVDGLQRLLDLFRHAGAGRAYLSKDRWVDPHTLTLPPDAGPYTDEHDLVHRTMDALIAHAAEHRQGVGSLYHVINHAAALVDLRRLGYAELATRGWAAQREHLRMWAALPDLSDELGGRVRSPEDPRTAAFWARDDLRRDSALLSHRVKTIYGYHVLASATDDDERIAAGWEAVRYLM